MKKVVKWFIKATVAGTAAILLLSVFCYFYSYDGIHIVSETGATDYVWESGQLKATMKEGFSRVHMDSYGYNNVYDYSEEPDILLMGSSHMEAAQVAETENVGYLLNDKLFKYKTYNIGISGHTIYRCIDNLENALETYHPQKYVVMVIDSVDLSIDEMKAVIKEEAVPIPSHDSGLIYYLQKIPAIKVIYKQLSDWMSLDNGSMVVKASNEKTDYNVEYDKTLCEFLEKAGNMAEESGVTLIVVYQPAQKLQMDGTIVYEYAEAHLEQFSEHCKKQGIVFVNAEKEFDKLYAEKNILAHGFSNSSVGEGHLNKYGHEAVANVIETEIKELEAE